MAVRAIRGATCVSADNAVEIRAAVGELLTAMLTENDVTADDLVSILFTATPDIVSTFPATAARQMGLTDVPLMCAQELAVADAMPRVVRVMMHTETPRSRREIRHPYLRGTDRLRADPEDDG